MKKKPKETKRITIRIPLELKGELETIADEEEHTLSGQIIFFLKRAVRETIKIIIFLLPLASGPP